ncbi:FprA family A-type flavoprotein [Seleniivibrio woodruffii]|uniref:FprA family A-type flavoprotein n=1 Tax=Seleniivibrio woodruffii TaxID=1078050 RepID=UPI0026F175DF|nr:FprA family A-type flavoprotein [Seleniivibrio woodruffii]
MHATLLKKDVYWVGVKDPELEIFDIVIPTEHGTTYNSYLVVGKEKTALIEACKLNFQKEYIARIEEIMPISRIDYVILNHNEPDHSGALPTLLDLNPDMEVIYSKTAKTFVENIVNRDFKGRAVGDEDVIDLGGKTLRFFHTPFLHWPDTMFTYLVEDEMLFPCDFLGAHYCPKEDILLNRDIEEKEVAKEAFRFYYSMIMRPYKEHITKALQKINGLKIDMVCPSHGPILVEDIDFYMDFYEKSAARYYKNMTTRQVTLVYATAYGNTKKLADQIRAGIEEVGVRVDMYDSATTDIMTLIDSIEISHGVLIGTPTLNAKAPHPVLELFSYFVVLNVVNRLGGCFGSYGWSGEGVKVSEDIMKTMRMKTPLPSFKVKMTPSEHELRDAYQWGRDFGMQVLEAQ